MIGTIESKKESPMRVAYKINNEWMSTFDKALWSFNEGDTVEYETKEVSKDGQVYHNLVSLEFAKAIKKDDTQVRIMLSVFMKIASEQIKGSPKDIINYTKELKKEFEREFEKR
jgi:hypothetical protein